MAYIIGYRIEICVSVNLKFLSHHVNRQIRKHKPRCKPDRLVEVINQPQLVICACFIPRAMIVMHNPYKLQQLRKLLCFQLFLLVN
jgi:hypothetical protein